MFSAFYGYFTTKGCVAAAACQRCGCILGQGMTTASEKTSNQDRAQQALDAIETPKIRWQVVGIALAVVAVAWLIAGVASPTLGIWGVVGAGVVTLLIAGVGIYALRMMRKSAGLVGALKRATDAQGRKEVLEELAASDPKGKDALKTVTRAQLLAQDDPQAAIKLLESLEIEKVSFVARDQVRATLAMLYLVHTSRVRDAREHADEIRIDRAGRGQDKAFLAAICAEAFARTGKTGESEKLLETYSAYDTSYGEARLPLLRAEFYTAYKLKKKGRAKKALEAMAALDVNALGGFVKKGHPEIQKMAREVAQNVIGMPKAAYMRPKRT